MALDKADELLNLTKFQLDIYGVPLAQNKNDQYSVSHLDIYEVELNPLQLSE